MKNRRSAIAWTTVLVALAAGLGGSMALLRVAAVGYCRAELQGQADRAATQLAKALIADPRGVAPEKLPPFAGTIAFGQWDTAQRRFVPGRPGANAVEVVVESAADQAYHNPGSSLFTPYPLTGRTRAVAAVRPRDIVFVVDLSGPMTEQTARELDFLLAENQETTPADNSLPSLYADLGFGACPGILERIGAPWLRSEGESVYEALTSETGPLAQPEITPRYRIATGDSISTRRHKAYLAVIEQQILRVMPEARPAPDRPENFEYWAQYLDDLLATDASNPRIGYATYLRFMLAHGRNLRARGRHVPLSKYSEESCWHTEPVAGREYSFPPRTQPMHDVRRGLLAALQEMADRNRALGRGEIQDRVALVTFDSLSPGGFWIEQPLTNDYAAIARKLARLQAVGQRVPVTSGLEALERARKLLQQSIHERPLGAEACRSVVFVTTSAPQADGELARQIAEMAELGQAVNVVPVSPKAELVAAETPTDIDALPTSGSFSPETSNPEGWLSEIRFMDAVSPPSVALVE